MITADFFASQKVDDLLQERRVKTLAQHIAGRVRPQKLGSKLIDVTLDTSVADGLQKMKDYDVYALPVVEPEDSEFRYRRIVSISDLLTPIFTPLGEKRRPTFEEDGFPSEQAKCLQKPIKSILDIQAPLNAIVFTDEKLEKVLYRLGSGGEHHLLCTDRNHVGDGNYYAIITQTDILHYLYQNRDHIASEILNGSAMKAAQTVKTSAEYIHAPALMPATATASEVAEALVFQKLSCIGITGADGRLVANISWADFRGLNASVFSKLERPCLEFVKQVQGLDPTSRHLELVSSKATVENVMKGILDHHVHRCFLVDLVGYTDSVVTISDLIHTISGL